MIFTNFCNFLEEPVITEAHVKEHQEDRTIGEKIVDGVKSIIPGMGN